MIANYHTHTVRCRHASGTPREYIESARSGGLQILGFSDHVPYPFASGYQSHFRMHVEETEAYVKELLALREEYKGQIEIHIGYEAEYYPAEFQGMLANISKYPCDYLLLGQHFLSKEEGGTYSGEYTEDKSKLTEYVDLMIQALRTKLFSCLVHPDLLHYRGDTDFYCQEMMRMLREAKVQGIPLEINLLGIRDHRHYPYEEFWKLVSEVGNEVILGLDAHSADVVADHASQETARKMADRLGIHLIDTLKFNKISE